MKLVLRLSSGKVLPEINTEWLNLSLFNDGEISQIEGSTPQMSLDDARIEMSKLIPYGTRTLKDLDAFIKAGKTNLDDVDHLNHDTSEEFITSWEEPGYLTKGGGPGCDFWFKKTFNGAQPLKLYFKLSWNLNRKSKESKSYNVPIPPPPGYEHVSMQAPKKFGPDSGADILRSKGVDIGDGRGGIPYEVYAKEAGLDSPLVLKSRTPAATQEESPPKVSGFWLWTLIVATSAFVVMLIIRIKKWVQFKNG